MKLIIREYLASLKERDELDAILPDLLSELGFVVHSRPQRGTTQHGVDIAAVGRDDDGEEKLFLFSVKRGDLTRQDWDGTPQGLRASLNEIIDVYIPTRIPAQYGDLKIVICLCFGGDIREQVRASVTGFINQNSRSHISFQEWNGDKLADLLLRGVLRDEVLPKQFRSHFQKAVATVDEPDVSYQHYAQLAAQLVKAANESELSRITAARQLYISLWILFVWARDIDNLEAPYQLSELAILSVWELLKPFIGSDNNDAKAINRVLYQLIQLHLIIATEFLDGRVLPHVGKLDALSLAIRTRTSVDVNLKLFDLLGRIAMAGLWLHWMASTSEEKMTSSTQDNLAELANKGFDLIRNNQTLLLPVSDADTVHIVLFLLLAVYSGSGRSVILSWLEEMVNRLDITVRTRGRYPSIYSDYRDLIDHPKDKSDEYFNTATAGSTLIPSVAAWLCGMKALDPVTKLRELKDDKLAHCTLQLWLPDGKTEESIYVGGEENGVSLSNLTITHDCRDLIAVISEACQREKGFLELSAVRTGYWAIVLLACRHYRYPVPPQFWIDLLGPQDTTARGEPA